MSRPKTIANDDDEPLHPERLARPTSKCPKANRADVNNLLRLCWSQGAWIVKGGKHFKVYSADGEHLVPVPATPSDWRSLRNIRSQLRRAGFDLSLKK